MAAAKKKPAEVEVNETPEAEVTPDPIPVFDDERAAGKTKPKFFVAGSTFFAQTDDGELKIPLRFKTKLVRLIRDMPGDELDQLFALLDGLGDQETADALDELDIFETTEIAEAYFQAWQEKNEARLGESQRSSNS